MNTLPAAVVAHAVDILPALVGHTAHTVLHVLLVTLFTLSLLVLFVTLFTLSLMCCVCRSHCSHCSSLAVRTVCRSHCSHCPSLSVRAVCRSHCSHCPSLAVRAVCRSPTHPFITVLTHRPAAWPLLTSQVEQLALHHDFRYVNHNVIRGLDWVGGGSEQTFDRCQPVSGSPL